MNILFHRTQASGNFGRVNFKLFAQVELDEEEKALVKRYHFDEAVLIAELQPTLIRNTGIVGALSFFVSFSIFFWMASFGMALFVALLVGIGAGWWFLNEKRETIFMRDLMNGRHFKCTSVIDLAKKEAWLGNVVATLRQVMVSAKNWDGPEKHEVEPLPPEIAKEMVLAL